jgi:hypothetical protein
MHIRSKRRHIKKQRPANDVSKEEIEMLFEAIKNHSGYPRLKDLNRMVPALTSIQVTVALRYLQRTGALVIDNDGYIVWTRQERPDLTLGEVADLSDEFRRFAGSSKQ